MNDRDVEELLRDALEAQAAAKVPDTRRPPHRDWPQHAAPRRWAAPLSVAAAVLLIAGGAAVVSRQSTTTTTATPSVSTGPVAPTTATPPPPTTAGPTTSTGAVPSSGPATSGTAPTSAPGSGVLAAVGGASLRLPAGWSFHPFPTTAQSQPISQTWCLSPQGNETGCFIRFERMNPAQNPIDSDTQGGYQSNPAYCGDGQVASSSLEYGDVPFGGRASEYRHWRIDCRAGSGLDVAQYTVVTPAPYQLFSDQATASVRAVMAEIVRSATLPAATGSVRLYDHGIVRTAVARSDGGWDITIDRVVIDRPNQSPTTYPYRVLPSAIPQTGAGPLAPDQVVSQTVDVFTDGSAVTQMVPRG